METVQPSTPPDSGQMSPDSPQTVAFDDMVDSSVPLFNLFNVSPVTPGILMRSSGAAVQNPGRVCHYGRPWILLATLCLGIRLLLLSAL